MELTTGSGASGCLHITHGTPVLRPTAIFAAHSTYCDPAVPNAFWIFPYSFSIYIYIHNQPFKFNGGRKK